MTGSTHQHKFHWTHTFCILCFVAADPTNIIIPRQGSRVNLKHIVYASHSSAGKKICKRFATDGEIDNTERIIMATEAIAGGIRPEVISRQHYPNSVMIHISEISWNTEETPAEQYIRIIR